MQPSANATSRCCTHDCSEDHVWRASRGMLYQLKKDRPDVDWGIALVDGESESDWVHIDFPDRVS